ncbi:DUF2171 domain-containing protein [Roseomonas sp. OT10]|uniref:DUF2171 domain-containing protein n=1 Tax=Roseomonas cutis TaxID=2897332 RepID=UPI001E2FF414|nr:DUF2171 domain-containing protein [Roseomonas sp. OT10]UFN48048.1 DUF2171 domain-containing protein [Roseomonas sp. OT10]
MVDTTLLQEGLPVVDCRGERIGTVDHLDAGRIRVVAANGERGYVPLAELSLIEADKVQTQTTREETLALMRSVGRDEGHTEA